jgi:hypothetical protein
MMVRVGMAFDHEQDNAHDKQEGGEQMQAVQPFAE